ncbi:MAG: helix-turn-helix domain-containing protein [Pseudomonadota bacterium]
MDQVPSDLIDSEQLTAQERLVDFQRITESIYEVQPAGPAEAFHVRSQGYRVGQLLFNQVRFSPARFRRDARHVRGRQSDFLVLHQQLEGEELIVMAHQRLRVVPGHLYLRDWAQPFSSEASAMALRSIVIPRPMLSAGAFLSPLNPVLSLALSEPLGRMMAAHWSLLEDELPRVTLAQAETLCDALLASLDALWSPRSASAVRPTLSAMQLYLSTRLMGPIEIDALCRHFDVSRSTVYRLFQPLGGVRRYIARLRLERCYADLWRADPAATQVGQVGASWGFDEASSFSRSFSAEFGVSPRDILGKGFGERREPEQAGTSERGDVNSAYLRWFEAASGVEQAHD